MELVETIQPVDEAALQQSLERPALAEPTPANLAPVEPTPVEPAPAKTTVLETTVLEPAPPGSVPSKQTHLLPLGKSQSHEDKSPTAASSKAADSPVDLS